MKSTLKVIHQGITLAVLLGCSARACAANAVVASPCGEAQFDTAFNAVNAGSGGILTFNCGGAKTITFTGGKNVVAPVTIDGANLITLDGNGSTYFFQVFSAKSLTLKNITLQNGADNGTHPLENFGALTLDHATVKNNVSIGSAVYNNDTLQVLASTFSGNSLQAGGDTAGAAIHQVSGSTKVTGSTFSSNTIPFAINSGTGGAIALGSGDLKIAHTTFSSNSAFEGGAIRLGSATTALIESSTFSGNSARYGGALENAGSTATIKQTSFTTNNTTGGSDGGAIWNLTGNLTIDSCEFTGNKAGSKGGAISHYGDILFVNNSAFSGNTSGTDGGAIYAGGDLYSNDSTFYNNTASGLGGALHQTGLAVFELTFATIVGNSAADGGLSGGMTGTHTPDVGYSIVSANKVGAGPTIDNCAGNFNSIGYNVSDGPTCGGVFTSTGDHVNVSVPMQTFANYGGPTSTLPPAASGNIAVNLIPTSPAGCVPLDQRGAVRPAGAKCDAGAFELNGIIDEIFKDGFEAF